jgi:hypothetical protein
VRQFGRHQNHDPEEEEDNSQVAHSHKIQRDAAYPKAWKIKINKIILLK